MLIACLALLVVSVVLLGLFHDLLYAALGLAVASIMLSVVLFYFGANVAAVFELSVCAGLITVLFVSTVSLTKDSDQKTESRLPGFFLVPMVILFVGIAAFASKWVAGLLPAVPATTTSTITFNSSFWGDRVTDILGQIALVLVGVFGILAIFRVKAAGRHHD
jgi:NADH-quinone oxidoreductase subunit J